MKLKKKGKEKKGNWMKEEGETKEEIYADKIRERRERKRQHDKQ
jgi:hypothetical protein